MSHQAAYFVYFLRVMTPLKIVCVDDENNALKVLKLELERCFDHRIKILHSFQSPLEAVDFINHNADQIDLLFLDINMPEMSGFDLLDQLNSKAFEVVFISAYSDHTMKAIKHRAFDYIVKPFDGDELMEIVEEIILKKADANREILSSIISALDKSNIIKVPSSDGYYFIDTQDIMYCESDSNYCTIVAKDRSYLISKTLKYITELINDEKHFLRIHQSYLVNVKYIRAYSRKGGSFVTLSNGDELKVSASKKDILNEI